MRAAVVSIPILILVSCQSPHHSESLLRHQSAPQNPVVPVTHGVAVGDVGGDSAVIWARTDQEAMMHVRVLGRHKVSVQTQWVTASSDFAGKVLVRGLEHGSEYRYSVWFTVGPDQDERPPLGTVEGMFRSPPKRETDAPVVFAWSGDLGGQNVCRDVEEGYPIFRAMNALEYDFFLAVGDMIYADEVCQRVGKYKNAQIPRKVGPATSLPAFWAHWKYNRADPDHQQLLARTSYYAIWDDHEVLNDFGPSRDTVEHAPNGPVHLMPIGRRAFLDYNPVRESRAAPGRLYRAVRWGRHLELFFLDTRQYRDASTASDLPESPKSMLGRDQRAWLESRLADSDATWQVVVSSVPISVPTGWPAERGRDGWASHGTPGGYESELRGILRTARNSGVRNLVWIATDVHHAAAFRYVPFEDDPEFRVHEFITGPMNAGLFPNRTFDESMRPERLFFYGPADAEKVTTFDEAKKWMNFGVMRIDEAGKLGLTIRDVDGDPVYDLALSPEMLASM